jgi:hypothetical protein
MNQSSSLQLQGFEFPHMGNCGEEIQNPEAEAALVHLYSEILICWVKIQVT